MINLDFKEIFTCFMILFAVIDIIGSIPIIVDLRLRVGHIQSEKASIIAGTIMLIFLLVGERLLGFLGVDVNSFAVAGALILFFIALEMILGIELYKQEEEEEKALSATVFPIAFPLVAGPGSLTTLLSLRANYNWQNIVIAILLNVIFIYIVLKTSKVIEKVIGTNGIKIIRKVFGVILLAISVKMFASNVHGLISKFDAKQKAQQTEVLINSNTKNK